MPLDAIRLPHSQRFFDARAYWEALSPGQQRAFGEAGLITLTGYEAQAATAVGRLSPQVAQRWREAVTAAWNRVALLVPNVARYPEGPDFGAIRPGNPACGPYRSGGGEA